MKLFFLPLLIVALAVSARATVVIQWSAVGNAGNANDSTGYGAVDYDYMIGTYEVTNAQYAAFLNAVDPGGTNTLSLYNGNMGSTARGGISFISGNAAGSKYQVKANMDNKPVNWVSWFDAARFSNWMQNGQGSGNTESGSYTLSGAMSGIGFSRATGTIGLPTENEWYKAAYHEPGGDVDNYWLNPTRSNTFTAVLAAANAVGDISNPGVDVINWGLGADWNSQNGNVTTVGSAGALAASYYGTFDQGGNVYELNDATSTTLGGSRGMRGGSYLTTSPADHRATLRYFFTSYAEADNVGFRLAWAGVVPEPSRTALAALGILLVMKRRRRVAA
ncbi:MAG: SUMF1/EgtB/PvdO family nonheme iron enzyme [Verrucomicrobiaceae bacterium]|nr:SUMF1/EgtB/PvdO family nonheme iron enzyme [Verrucomicrobiaceae bacterium]